MLSNEGIKLFYDEVKEHLDSIKKTLSLLQKDPAVFNSLSGDFEEIRKLSVSIGFVSLDLIMENALPLLKKIKEITPGLKADAIQKLYEIYQLVSDFALLSKKTESFKNDPGFTLLKIADISETIDSIKNKTNKKSGNIQTKNIAANIEPGLNELFLGLTQRDLITHNITKGFKTYLITVEIDSNEKIKWMYAKKVLENIPQIGILLKYDPNKTDLITKEFAGILRIILQSKMSRDFISKKIFLEKVCSLKIEDFVLTKASYDISNSKIYKYGKFKKEKKIVKKYRIESASKSIRVPIRKLDVMMNLIGEMVISTSGFKRLEQKIHRKYHDSDIYYDVNLIAENLIEVISDLQKSIMHTRMLPISRIFNQYKKVAQDLAKADKKEITLIMKGEDTELDKKVIDAIGDPILHLVRNAVDHGIESTEERIKKGKKPNGRILLSASQISNHIIITIEDDGRGIDIDKVREKALKKNLITEEKIELMEKNQILNLIFEPGFSTRDEVSAVSGRGVGMDVVKAAISLLNGSIDIKTEYGKGSEFILSLPLTLRIINVILCHAGKNNYAISIIDTIETIKVMAEDLRSIKKYQAIDYRGEIVTVVSLKSVFENNIAKVEKKTGLLNIVITKYRDKKLGIILDEIYGTQDIVLKTLGKNYKHIRGLSGASLLDDGRVVLVVDVPGFMDIVGDIAINS